MEPANGKRFLRLLQLAGLSFAALASCYLGLLLSRLLWDAPHLLVAAFTDAEVISFGRFGNVSLLPSFYVLQPSEAPPLAFAVYAIGAIVVAVASLVVCTRLVNACSGWLRLFVIFLAFWTSLLLVGAAVAFAGRALGPLAAVASLTGMTATTPGRWVLAATVILICFFCLMRVLQSLAAETESSLGTEALWLALWFVLPIVVLSATLSAASWRMGRLPQFGGAVTPLLVAALPALAALRARRRASSPFHPTLKGALLTLATAAASIGAVVAYPAMARRPEQPRFETAASKHWEISFEQGIFAPAERQAWAEAADHRLESYSERLGIPLKDARLHARVFLSTKSKRAVTPETRDDQPFTLSGDPLTLDQLLAPGKTLDDPRCEPLLLMAHAWGPPASQSIADAVARYAAGGFLRHSLPDYARRIACEEQPYTLTDILDIAPRYLSPLVRDALSGAWVESTVEQRGTEILPSLYRAIPAQEGPQTIAVALGKGWNGLEAEWQSYLEQPAASCDPPARSANAAPRKLHHGISFSHEVGGDWGYGSDSARRELEKIRELGANTVAIMPYAFTRAPEETSIRFRTDETDARVIRAIEQARQAGLSVMLKPHLWGRGFTGDMKFSSDEDFAIWWESYRSWLLHFARLAELYNVELLVLGNELGGMTLHEQAWRELISDVRRIYGGELTYASHWDGEFERIPFWDQLDYIGVNAYFPLAAPGETPDSDSPRIAEVRSHLAALSERFQKRVLFTEVGYSSMRGAAVEPWAERTGTLDLQIQQQCYEVIFEAFEQQPWFAGMYWWKWPSHGRGGPYDLTHRPNGKPAMDVLRRWFQANRDVSINRDGAWLTPWPPG